MLACSFKCSYAYTQNLLAVGRRWRHSLQDDPFRVLQVASRVLHMPVQHREGQYMLQFCGKSKGQKVIWMFLQGRVGACHAIL